MADPIKNGDLVHLKSGGPTMTVHLIYKPPNTQGDPTFAKCSWFDGKVMLRNDFNVQELVAGEAPNLPRSQMNEVT